MYDEIICFTNLLRAYYQTRRCKRFHPNFQKIELNYEDILVKLHWKLKNHLYYPKPYTKFTVFEPKKRQVAAPNCFDRVVHHAILNIIEPLFQKQFISHSYACQKNKGPFLLRSDLAKIYQNLSQKHRQFYALKCDIKSYFANINHQILLQLLQPTISCPETITLLATIINSYHETPGVGIPIGNLTSQLFANLYLHPLDMFTTKHIGEKNYFRYMDDFLVLSPDKEYLLHLRALMRGFINYYLKIDYHPQKNNIFRADFGVDFAGYLFKPTSVTMRKRTVRRFKKRHKRRVKLLKKLLNQNQPQLAKTLQLKLVASKNSLRGFLKDTNYQVTERKLLKINGIVMPKEL
ncbi:reverse transcriptase/maturase family protein [Patescibacteria group bacterium]|nr:reverse transcriptase/maturase family protein [Patescibacteria group bacterium]